MLHRFDGRKVCSFQGEVTPEGGGEEEEKEWAFKSQVTPGHQLWGFQDMR